MHCVAAEVAQKITVLLKHQHLNASARQQKSEHNSGRASTGNAAISADSHRALLSRGSAKSQCKFRQSKLLNSGISMYDLRALPTLDPVLRSIK
jgi:hypothetical protein